MNTAESGLVHPLPEQTMLIRESIRSLVSRMGSKDISRFPSEHGKMRIDKPGED